MPSSRQNCASSRLSLAGAKGFSVRRRSDAQTPPRRHMLSVNHFFANQTRGNRWVHRLTACRASRDGTGNLFRGCGAAEAVSAAFGSKSENRQTGTGTDPLSSLSMKLADDTRTVDSEFSPADWPLVDGAGSNKGAQDRILDRRHTKPSRFRVA